MMELILGELGSNITVVVPFGVAKLEQKPHKVTPPVLSLLILYEKSENKFVINILTIKIKMAASLVCFLHTYSLTTVSFHILVSNSG